jgi:hypothetical protein
MQAVVDPSGPTVVGFAPSNAVLMGDFQNFVKVDYPLEMEAETLGVTYDSESQTYSFVTDPLKVQAKLEAAWTQLRAERNRRLAATDWTQLADAHLSQEKKDAWSAYRQELRDLPDVVTDPTQVPWPVAP